MVATVAASLTKALPAWVFLSGMFLPGLCSADSAPTLKELKNASYFGIEGLKSPVKLVDGRWKGRPYKKGSASRPVVNLVRDFRITGDLDGDGKDESVVFLNYAPGGTGQLLHLAVVARKNGKIQNVATTLLGDRVQVRDFRIEEKRLLVDVVRSGPKDAKCCPGEVTTLGWTLEPGGKLNTVTATRQAGVDSVSRRSGTQNGCCALGISSEPAPAHPLINLIFKDGRFTGSSGCNNYFATANEGTMPGDVGDRTRGNNAQILPGQNHDRRKTLSRPVRPGEEIRVSGDSTRVVLGEGGSLENHALRKAPILTPLSNSAPATRSGHGPMSPHLPGQCLDYLSLTVIPPRPSLRSASSESPRMCKTTPFLLRIDIPPMPPAKSNPASPAR